MIKRHPLLIQIVRQASGLPQALFIKWLVSRAVPPPLHIAVYLPMTYKINSRYHSPVFSMETQGSAGASASPR